MAQRGDSTFAGGSRFPAAGDVAIVPDLVRRLACHAIGPVRRRVRPSSGVSL
jgi:hypothetical protein